MCGESRVASEWQLAEWIVRPQRDCIERGEETVHVKPKAMAVLACLLRAGGNVVTRDELFDTVWPGGVVSDATLTQCIVELRQALGDSAREPRYIETVPKVGFRLIPQAVRLEEAPSAPASMAEPAAPGAVAGPRWHGLSAAGMAAIIVALMVYLAISWNTETPATPDSEQTLAVLPFSDLSPDQDQGWFTDGLSEELILRLNRLEGLRVTGRTSSFYFKYKNVTVGEIGESLGVDNVLNGSVRRVGDQLRISAELLDAATGFPLWSEVYERPIEDVFAVQQEIADSVADRLSIRLGVGALGTMPGGTSKVEAYERLLFALSLFQECSAESMLEAIALVEQAVAIDPAYALGWLWLSELYIMAPHCIDDRVQREWSELSEQALNRARIEEPEMPQLVAMELNVHMQHRRWAEAEGVVQRAGPVDSLNDPNLLFHYGIFLLHVGRASEALAILEQARLYEPRAGHFSRMLAQALLVNGRIDDALAEFERAWNIDNTIRRVCGVEGLVAALAGGDSETSRMWLMRAIDHADTAELDLLEAMEQRFGNREAATDWLRDAFDRGEWANNLIAAWAAYYGDTRLILDVQLRRPNNWEFWLPQMADLRRQPEFKHLADTVGLVDYWREYTWADFCRPQGENDFECE